MTAWNEIAEFLADPSTHDVALDAIEVVETHGAFVVLTPERAYKLRRSVDYGWLDYGTPERRRHFAAREVELNAPNAPELYLGVGWIARAASGALALREPEELASGDERLEPVVVMRRFADEALLDSVAREGGIDWPLADAMGRAVAEMHRRARPLDKPVRLARFVATEAAELTSLEALADAEPARYGKALKSHAESAAQHAERRRTAGAIRLCHGDLHLRNMVMWQGRPTPFDRIEFNDDLAETDVLYDLAFLLMDLVHRDLGEAANAVLNAWAERIAAEPDGNVQAAYDGFALLPLYLSLRAAIRAKVGAIQARDRSEQAGEAVAYVDLARAFLEAVPPPLVVAVGGRSGAGKSVLARALAPTVGATPGAVILRSDAIRKGLHGVDFSERLPKSAYTQEASDRVYDAMLRRADMMLRGGRSVVLDAAHLKPAERRAAEDLAAEHGIAFCGFWLELPLEQRLARIGGRDGDVSDADRAVAEKQEAVDVEPIEWAILDAGRPAEENVERMRQAVARR